MVLDLTTTGPVVVRHLAGLVMGADTGVPLVPREASAMAVAIVVDITLCGRGRAKRRAGCVSQPGSQDEQLPDT